MPRAESRLSPAGGTAQEVAPVMAASQLQARVPWAPAMPRAAPRQTVAREVTAPLWGVPRPPPAEPAPDSRAPGARLRPAAEPASVPPPGGRAAQDGWRR